MAVGVELRQKTALRTELKLTPELRTALELLQLPQIELEQRIAEEIQENPLLEWEEDLPEIPEPVAPLDQRVEGTDFARRTEGPDFDPFQRFISSESGLHGHVEWQVEVAPWPAEVKEIALDLVPRISPDGILYESDEELAAEHGVRPVRIREAREHLQQLEPTGVAAADLSECLLLQLRERDAGDSLAARLLEEARDALEAGDLAAVADTLGVGMDEVTRAMGVLRTLDPTPGSRYRDDTSDPISPEVVIERSDAGWRVEPYRPYSRRVRRSPVMIQFREEPEAFSKAETRYLREKMRAAEYFLDSLKQRELTLMRVTEAIIDRQEAMLEVGPEAAAPLTLRDIADRVDLHESTISRVTRRRYAITPRGIWELKSFFRQDVGGGHTPHQVQHRISELVRDEPQAKPLSDQAISDRLKQEGMDIARRTVAKYRNEMEIPSRSERKRAYAAEGSDGDGKA